MILLQLLDHSYCIMEKNCLFALLMGKFLFSGGHFSNNLDLWPTDLFFRKVYDFNARAGRIYKLCRETLKQRVCNWNAQKKKRRILPELLEGVKLLFHVGARMAANSRDKPTQKLAPKKSVIMGHLWFPHVSLAIVRGCHKQPTRHWNPPQKTKIHTQTHVAAVIYVS